PRGIAPSHLALTPGGDDPSIPFRVHHPRLVLGQGVPSSPLTHPNVLSRTDVRTGHCVRRRRRPGGAALSLVTELSARCVVAGPITMGPNSRPRKMSSVGLARFRFNRPFAGKVREQGPRTRRTPMKQPSVYLKMRVLGAVDTALGRTRHQRVNHV